MKDTQPMITKNPTISEISAKLSDQAEAIARFLLPAGRKVASEWQSGGLGGEEGKSLKISLSGEHAGKWRDWNGGEGGDLIDLWAAVKCLSVSQALKEAKSYLGIASPVFAEKKSYTLPKDDKAAIKQDGAAMDWLISKRQLNPSIVNRYKVQTDNTKRAIVFPCYSPEGVLVNRSYRCIELDENGKKRVWQDAGAAPILWGWQGVSAEAFRKREILICEGQIDAMTWAQWGIEALSIPNGSGQAWIAEEWDNLEPFSTIYLSFDTDGKSDKNLKGVIDRLGRHRCRVVKIEGKDANDCMIAGKTIEDARRWLQASEYPPLQNLFTGKHYIDDVVEAFFPTSSKPNGHTVTVTESKFDKSKNFYFRPGEITLWSGISGHGKSTMLSGVMMELMFITGAPAFIASLETVPYRVIKQCLQSAKLEFSNPEKVRNAMELYGDNFLFANRVGKIKQPELWEMLYYSHSRYGITHAYIDSFMRVAGLEENYPAQNDFVTELATFTRETGVHVHLVAHPKKMQQGFSPDGGDIKGSGHIRDNADNVLIVSRNIDKEKKEENGEDVSGMPDASLLVDKDREGTGEYRKFNLSFDRRFRRYDQWMTDVRKFTPDPEYSERHARKKSK